MSRTDYEYVDSELRKINHRLATTTGRSIHEMPEMQRVIQTMLAEPCRGLIIAGAAYRCSPLRAIVMFLANDLDEIEAKLRAENRLRVGAVRQVTNRALSEALREVCDVLGLEPTGASTVIGYGGHNRGKVYRKKRQPKRRYPGE